MNDLIFFAIVRYPALFIVPFTVSPVDIEGELTLFSVTGVFVPLFNCRTPTAINLNISDILT